MAAIASSCRDDVRHSFGGGYRQPILLRIWESISEGSHRTMCVCSSCLLPRRSPRNVVVQAEEGKRQQTRVVMGECDAVLRLKLRWIAGK